jgi:tetratricopeptide (TPR) repeat protein
MGRNTQSEASVSLNARDDSEDPLGGLVSTLLARVARFVDHEDRSAILGPESDHEAARLRGLIGEQPLDGHASNIEALRALAIYHWCRYQALPQGEDQEDLRAALVYFASLLSSSSELVPEPLRTLLQASGAASVAGIITAEAAAHALAEYRRIGSEQSLDVAISSFSDALAGLPPGPDRVQTLSNYSVALLDRFSRAGRGEDLNRAIDMARAAIHETPLDHALRGSVLANLGAAHRARFEWTGDSNDLSEAITELTMAVNVTSLDDPDRASILSMLGNAQVDQFALTGDVAYLNEAIKTAREATLFASIDDLERGLRLSNLGASLRMRFERTGEAADLDEAVTVGREAVWATPTEHPDRAAMLSNLGASLRMRFERTGEAAVLDEAVTVGREAVWATPTEHPRRAAMLSNLGASLRMRFERTGEAADLEEAVTVGREALSATGTDDPSRATVLSALAESTQKRARTTGSGSDLKAALELWREASVLWTTPPETRLAAAWNWAEAAIEGGLLDSALEGYSEAIKMLREFFWRSPGRHVRFNEHIGGLASDAAACAILTDHAELAVEFLEQARCISWAWIAGSHPDLDQLRTVAPDLKLRLERVRLAIGSFPVNTSRRNARESSQEWEELLAQIRTMGGLKDFLQPTPYSTLSHDVTAPVVVLNASRFGCHAIVIDNQGSSPKVVHLPALRYNVIVEQVNRLVGVLVGPRGASAVTEGTQEVSVVTEILAWAWDVIASPILDTMGIIDRGSSTHGWPRISWYPTGPLTMLPIHAAGRYQPSNSAIAVEAVHDRVVSSYTASVAALVGSGTPTLAHKASQLAVAMPDTPGLPALPAAVGEIQSLARHVLTGDLKSLVGSQATRAEVLNALTDHSLVHLACHALQHPTDPGRNAIALWDGVVTVADLVKDRVSHRELVVLSACETAATDTRIPDDVVHFGGLMQLLGYRHVIATMWRMPASLGPTVAEALYSDLKLEQPVDSIDAAWATHRAVAMLRNASPTNPLHWAALVHFGPA